jgi:hypothetical protein
MMPRSESDERLLQKVANDHMGGLVEEMLEHFVHLGHCPGICTTCHAVTDHIEHDMEEGLCEECETETVKSIFILAGVI